MCVSIFYCTDRKHSVLSYDLPILADEEVFPVSGSDGHHLIRVTFKHLMYGLHFFMATYANFHTGISVRYIHKVLNRFKHED